MVAEMGVKFVETIDHAFINTELVDMFRVVKNEEENVYEVRAYMNYFGDKKNRKYLILSSHATNMEAYQEMRKIMAGINNGG